MCAAKLTKTMMPITLFFPPKSITAKERQIVGESGEHHNWRKLCEGDLNRKDEKHNGRSQEAIQLAQKIVQQGKGDSARRSKEEAERKLRDISRQL